MIEVELKHKDIFFYSKFVPNYVIMRKSRASLFYFSLFILFTGCSGKEYLTSDGFAQGTTYHIVYSNDTGYPLDSLIASIFTDVDNSLSVYNKESLISKINNGEESRPDSLIRIVYERSLEIYHLSDGLFDVSASPLFNIWGFGFSNRSIITQEVIDSALNLTGMEKIRLENGRFVKDSPGVTLNFNAIAKGYTSDVIAGELRKLGIENYLIEVGGEIACKGKNPSGKKWSVGIDKPEEGNIVQGAHIQGILLLSGEGLATSGNYRKYYEENGKIYSHTINPKTGYPVRHNLLSATVLAVDAMTADAYATWFMVAGLEKSIEIIENNNDIEGYLIYMQDGEYKVYKSSGVVVK